MLQTPFSKVRRTLRLRIVLLPRRRVWPLGATLTSENRLTQLGWSTRTANSGSAMEKDGEKMYALLVSPSMLLFDIQKHREDKELSRSIQSIGNPVPNSSASFAFQAPLLDQFAAKPAAADPAAPAGQGKGPLRRHDEPRWRIGKRKLSPYFKFAPVCTKLHMEWRCTHIWMIICRIYDILWSYYIHGFSMSYGWTLVTQADLQCVMFKSSRAMCCHAALQDHKA